METMVLIGAISVLSVIALAQAVLLWRASRSLRRLDAIDERVEKFGEALTLLTDTTESAFRAVATQLVRTPEAPVLAGSKSAARTARVARAAKRGKSISEIAAWEGMAEGEVRLRLQVANNAPLAAAAGAAAVNAWEANRGALRVD
jgi:hypothetical protein